MKLRTFENLTLYRFRYKIGYGSLIGLGLLLLLYKLGSLVPGLSAPEVAAAQSSNLSAIWQNPVYAPYRLLQEITLTVFGQNAWGVRLPSVIFGAATVFGVYLFLRSVLAERVAVMGALLVGFSTFLLGFSRLGIPAISLAWALSALLGVSSWLMASNKRGWWQISNAVIVAVFGLYIPLGWLWLLIIIASHPKQFARFVRRASNVWLSLGILGGLAAITPLVWATVRDPAIVKSFLLLPEQLPTISTLATNALKIAPALGWRHLVADPITHLGNLAILDVFTSAMVLTGILTLIMKPTLARTRILFICGVSCLTVLAVNLQSANFAVLIPLVGILGAIGLERMLMEWYEMFPLNPFARVGALVPLAIIFAMAMLYHVHRGYIAWPRTPEVKAAFQQKL